MNNIGWNGKHRRVAGKVLLCIIILMGMLCYGGTSVKAADVQNGTTRVPTEQEAYEAMIALKEQYPEGTPWTLANRYNWKGGITTGSGGCTAFAFMLSDAAFGDLPARKIYNFDEIHVGDILRVNNDTHTVIVLEVHDTYVIIAEGNYTSSVHWGRKITFRSLNENGTYMMTRYPEGTFEKKEGLNLASDGNWYYYINGEIATDYTGLASNEYGWWYVRNGALDWNYTGMASNEYGWWYVRNGALDWNYTGMASNEYGWWYMRNGALDLTYSGIAFNEYGAWYYESGMLNFGYTGVCSWNGMDYYVVNGYAQPV